MDSSSPLVFFPFHLDLVNEQLWRGTQLVTLRPKTWTVLRYLVEHPGRLITKEELLDNVWAGTRVSPTLPKDYIQELRKALGDISHSPRFIETVHGRGYRFIAPVTAAPVPSSKFQVPSSDTQDLELKTQDSVVVGRKVELVQLHQWWAQTVAGERRVVFITGEAGIGKTTLVEAFLAQVRTQHGGLIAQGQCFEQYGEGEAYMPMLDALGQLCRESRNSNLLALLTHYAPTWLVQMPGVNSPEELEALRRRIQDATRERMLREMAEALEAITAEQPLLLVLEDLHWSDTSTLDLITVFAQRKPPARLLILCSYRPADARVQNHHISAVANALQLRRQCEELPLNFLPETEVTAYLAARFPASLLPTKLGPLIHQRTEGNPLFMVNLVDHLTTQGFITHQQGAWIVNASLPIIEQSIPNNVGQMIEQQLDALDPHDRLLLEVASVAGMEFWAAAIAAGMTEEIELVEEHCAALARKEQFINFQDHQEWSDGSVTGRYSFVHALHQEILYRRLTPSRRARLHKNIGERIAAGHQDRDGAIAGLLAFHFEHGREYERAVHYFHVASENALQRCAYQEAIAHGTKALELLKFAPESFQRTQQELMLQMALGPPLIATKGHASPEVEQTYAHARELCRQVGETPQLFPVLWGIWVTYFVRGDLTTAKELGEQLRRLTEDTDNIDFRLEACVAVGLTAVCLGEFTTALQFLQRGSALYDRDQHQGHAFVYGQDPGMVCLSWTAWALWFLGYPEQALQASREAVALARRHASPFSLAYALSCITALHQFRREVNEVKTCTQENIVFSASQGFTLWYAGARVLLGWTLAEQDRLEEGMEEFSTGLQAWQATGAGFLQSWGLSLLPAVYQRTGHIDEGLAALARAFTIVEQWGERFWEAELHRLKGELTLQQLKIKNAEYKNSEAEREAEACFLQAIAIARRQQAKSLELRAATSLCRLWRRQGKRAAARRLLQKIYAWFTEGFATADLVEARTLLDELAQ